MSRVRARFGRQIGVLVQESGGIEVHRACPGRIAGGAVRQCGVNSGERGVVRDQESGIAGYARRSGRVVFVPRTGRGCGVRRAVMAGGRGAGRQEVRREVRVVEGGEASE